MVLDYNKKTITKKVFLYFTTNLNFYWKHFYRQPCFLWEAYEFIERE